MAKIIIPAVTVVMTAGFCTSLSVMAKKLSPIFATVRQ